MLTVCEPGESNCTVADQVPDASTIALCTMLAPITSSTTLPGSPAPLTCASTPSSLPRLNTSITLTTSAVAVGDAVCVGVELGSGV